jgi:hypothetical protein
MFNIEYLAYNLVPIRTGGVEAPKMNSIMERFFRTVRRGALDNYLLTGKNQVQRILDEYVAFQNGQRPHRGSSNRFRNQVNRRRQGDDGQASSLKRFRS